MEKLETEGLSFDLKDIRVVRKPDEIVKWINAHQDWLDQRARGEHDPK